MNDLDSIFRWPPTPAKWQALKAYLRSQRISTGPGLRGAQTSSGVVLASIHRPAPPKLHPFALHAWYDAAEEKTWLQANHGTLTRNNYAGDGAGDFSAVSTDYAVRMGGSTGAALGLGSDAPKIELTAGIVFGVWVVSNINDSSQANPGTGTWRFISGTGEPYLLASADATTPGASASIAGVGDKFHAWFIGRVEVDEHGIPRVTQQHRRSDISHQGCAWFEPEPPDPEA